MKTVLSSIILVFISVWSFESSASFDKPALYGVMFYADWCGSCKTLDPKIKKARANAGLDKRDVLFVTFDLTDKASSQQAALMASALNLGALYEDNGGKTGFMMLVDANTGEAVGHLNKNMSVEQIASAIQEKI